MTFEVFKSVCVRFLCELLVKFRVSRNESYVHHRTALFLYGGYIVILAIEIIVKQFCFLYVHLFHLFKSAKTENPLVNELCYVNAVARRCVVHRIVLRHYAVIEHCGNVGAGVAYKVLTDYDNGKSCGRHILLCACIDKTEL